MEAIKGSTRKKKVLLVVRWPVGGIRTFIRYVYRNFDPKRWKLTIIAPHLSETPVLIEDLAGLDVRYIAVQEEPHPAQFFVNVAYEVIRGGYDLVHSHGFTSGMSAVLPAVLRRTPHLMTSHETLNLKQFIGLRGKAVRFGMEGLLRLIDIVHSVSNDAQKNLIDFFPCLSRKDGKCAVIQNGIEIERFAETEPRDLRGELSLGNDVFLIGFLGRFMSVKGFRYLVDAIELIRAKDCLTKLPLVLAFGEGGFIREEIQAIEKRGLKEYFCFMPFTPNVAATIKGLDVVVMPSLCEACGLLAMEVLACGVPLIGSDCVGLREVLQGTPASVVPKANAVALANALEREMRTDSKGLFLSFREKASEMFDVRRTSQSILNLYERMTGQSN